LFLKFERLNYIKFWEERLLISSKKLRTKNTFIIISLK